MLNTSLSRQVFVIEPAGVALPLVCDSPHSGTAYPDDFGFAAPLMALRQCEDTFVEELWAHAPDVGATLIHANFPRSYIDANRAESDIDQAMLSDPWPRAVSPSDRCIRLGNGLVFSKTPKLEDIYQRKLSVAEVENRINNYWRPYRQALAEALALATQEFGRRWHLNLHSMPSNAYERLGMSTDLVLADIVLGNMHGRSCSGEFTDFVADTFRSKGYSVAINDPYAGQDLLLVHGDASGEKESLQIEIKRSVYLNEASRTRSERFDRFQSDISDILQIIATHIQSSLNHPQKEVAS